MPDVTPVWIPGDTFTGHASAAVTGGRCVGVSGVPVDGNPRVAHAGAAGQIIGVAARDKGAGEKVMIYGGPGTIIPIRTGGAVTAGQRLEVGANGTVVTLAAGIPVAVALDDAANGADVLARLL